MIGAVVFVIAFLLFLLTILGCKNSNETPDQERAKQELIFHEQKKQISAILEKTIHETIEGMNTLAIDSIFKNISRENFEGFAGNGMALTTYEETYSILKYMYGEMGAYNISCFDEKYIILSETSGMYTANYDEELRDKKDNLNHSRGVLTVIFKNLTDSWEIIYIHTSSYPIAKN